MRAYLLETPNTTLNAADLAAEGILYWQLPTDAHDYAEPLDQIRRERGYVQMDQIHLQPDTPNLGELSEKFFTEHLHTDEEIRFVIAGSGFFDLRDKADAWMRVHVEAGDMIIVPADKYHRFALDSAATITCKRLFQDDGGWTPVNRPQ